MQENPEFGQQVTIGILATIIGGIILYILALPIRRFIVGLHEKNRERNSKLNTHFAEIKEEAKSDLSEVSNVVEMYGVVVVRKGSVPLYHPNSIVIELPKFSDSFAAHFPEFADKWIECVRKILDHDKSYRQLVHNIRSGFESRGFPVVDVNHPPSVPPYIYENIYPPLFNWWKDRHQGKSRPWPDFGHIETKPDFGPNALLAAGWGSSAIAYAETEEDRERCKHAIRRLAQNKGYEKEAALMIELANQLVHEVREFKSEVVAALDDIEKYWPGTTNYRFKESKNCPRCKDLFH